VNSNKTGLHRSLLTDMQGSRYSRWFDRGAAAAAAGSKHPATVPAVMSTAVPTASQPAKPSRANSQAEEAVPTAKIAGTPASGSFLRDSS
jgi:hypothetical protein